ncbi:hypothetical protein ACHAW5_002165 [Stephanodiscus triporus]|uniref:Uncharacterized protein n=1 Tax=Stephanodiscus triporus TaxID=2934178 RepID=A0ABD3Q4P2_9STRA
METMTPIKCNRRNGIIRLDFVTVAALTLLLPYPSEGESALAPIHGINQGCLHLNKRGGALATRKRNWRRSHSVNTLPHGETAETTEYWLEPVQKYVRSIFDGKAATAPKAVVSTGSHKQQNKDEGLTTAAITCMSLLALQFGIQPILVRKFTPQTIVRSSVVLVQELVKFGIAGAIYFSGTKKETREQDFEDWSVKTWIAFAGLPAFLYTIQNVAALMAYQNLDGLTFNVLNQTKILSAALSCYFVMGKRQSKMQVISLCILIFATLVIEQVLKPSAIISLLSMRGGATVFGLQNAIKGMAGAFSSNIATKHVSHGVIPLLVASLISGMAGALTQKNLQGSMGGTPILGKERKLRKTPPALRPPRNAYLFSMEMNVASVILLLASLLLSSDGRTIIRSPYTFFSNWTPETFIPVITNSIGGILVGLVTKHAGSVRKSFALIFGLLLSGMLQAGGAGIQAHQVVGGLLAAVSLWMHTMGSV